MLWWRVQVGHGSGAQPKKLAFDFTHRAPRTDIYYANIMRPDPAVESSRFGNQIPNMSDRYKWVRPFRPDLGEALAWVSTFEHSRQVLCSPVHGVQPPVRSGLPPRGCSAAAIMKAVAAALAPSGPTALPLL